MTQLSTELAPCPFCGHPARANTIHNSDGNECGATVECTYANCPANPSIENYDAEQAIHDWNAWRDRLAERLIKAVERAMPLWGNSPRGFIKEEHNADRLAVIAAIRREMGLPEQKEGE